MIIFLLTMALYIGIAELLLSIVLLVIKGLWHVGKAIFCMIFCKDHRWNLPTSEIDPWDQ